MVYPSRKSQGQGQIPGIPKVKPKNADISKIPRSTPEWKMRAYPHVLYY